MARLGWRWTAIAMVVLVVAGGGVYIARHGHEKPPLEIVTPTPSARQIQLHVDGVVRDPGVYAVSDDASLKRILVAAGGLRDGIDATRIDLYVAEGATSAPDPQKVNLNLAPSWMLEALPGVGPTLAGRIVSYRDQQPFLRVSQLGEVDGIGPATYDRLKDLVTVE